MIAREINVRGHTATERAINRTISPALDRSKNDVEKERPLECAPGTGQVEVSDLTG